MRPRCLEETPKGRLDTPARIGLASTTAVPGPGVPCSCSAVGWPPTVLRRHLPHPRRRGGDPPEPFGAQRLTQPAHTTGVTNLDTTRERSGPPASAAARRRSRASDAGSAAA